MRLAVLCSLLLGTIAQDREPLVYPARTFEAPGKMASVTVTIPGQWEYELRCEGRETVTGVLPYLWGAERLVVDPRGRFFLIFFHFVLLRAGDPEPPAAYGALVVNRSGTRFMIEHSTLLGFEGPTHECHLSGIKSCPRGPWGYYGARPRVSGAWIDEDHRLALLRLDRCGPDLFRVLDCDTGYVRDGLPEDVARALTASDPDAAAIAMEVARENRWLDLANLALLWQEAEDDGARVGSQALLATAGDETALNSLERVLLDPLAEKSARMAAVLALVELGQLERARTILPLIRETGSPFSELELVGEVERRLCDLGLPGRSFLEGILKETPDESSVLLLRVILEAYETSLQEGVAVEVDEEPH